MHDVALLRPPTAIASNFFTVECHMVPALV